MTIIKSDFYAYTLSVIILWTGSFIEITIIPVYLIFSSIYYPDLRTFRVCTKVSFTNVNAHADVSNMVRVLNFALRLHLHPYFMYTSSEGSVETAQLHRLSRAFVARQCDDCLPLKRQSQLLQTTHSATSFLISEKIRQDIS